MLEETKLAISRMVEDAIRETHRTGVMRYGNERQITQEQEMAYRLCHHDFFGLSNGDAADIMGTTPHAVDCLLNRLRAVAPQLFPILRPFTARVYRLFVHDSMTIREIADEMCVGVLSVRTVLKRLHRDRKRTGLYFPSGTSRRLSYCNWMDPHIRTAF